MSSGSVLIPLIVGLLAAAAGAAAAAITLRRLDAARGERRDADALADIDELTRRLAEQLDAKAAQLDELIREADNRLARLQQAVGSPPPRAPHRPVYTPPAREPDAAPTDPITARIYELADRGCTPVEIAQNLGQHVGNVELILALRR